MGSPDQISRVGAIVRRERRRLGYSQEKLAEIARSSTAVISRLEKGKRLPRKVSRSSALGQRWA